MIIRKPLSVLRNLIFMLYAYCFGRALFKKWNYFLFQLSLRGLGVLNYQSARRSGERYFLNKILSNISEPVVFDVGANIGDYASLVRTCNARAQLVCFEPHPKNLPKLQAREELDADIVECAVGNNPGQLELFDYSDNDGSSHASIYQEVIEEIHGSQSVSHTVDVITLDYYCKSHAVDRIDLLKIDTEGNELAVLTGAKQLLAERRIDIVHFEFNEMNIISQTFLREFRNMLYDFTFYRLLPTGWIALQCDRFDEIFAYQNIIAVRDGVSINC